MLNSGETKFLVDLRHKLVERKFLLTVFTTVSNYPTHDVDKLPDMVDGVITDAPLPQTYEAGTILRLREGGKTTYDYYGVLSHHEHWHTLAVMNACDGYTGPITIRDSFTLRPGNIENYVTGPEVETSVGRFILNYIVLARAIGNTIPYINDVWNIKKIEKKIADAALSKTITADQANDVIDGMFFIGHFTELGVPTATKRSLTTDPNVDKRKAELFAQYRGQLTDPVVMKKIEDELLAMDAEWLKGDASLRFLVPLGKKQLNVSRKKMFLTIGGIEDFTDGMGKYTFIENSLAQGWDKQNFPAIANEVRKGSFERGHETQKGGALSKFITRIFQDLEIKEDDCHTERTLAVDFSELDISQFIGRTIVEHDEYIEITAENMSKYNNKTVQIRSPLLCETKNGLCYTCTGSNFRKLDVHGLSMLVVDISSTFINLSLKSMHGTKIELIDIDPFDYFVS